MPKLHVQNGPDAGRTFTIADGATLGRDMGCTVVLNDVSVSRRHARIVHEGGMWRVLDTQSRNGLTVGGARVESAPLRDGADFQLGDVRIRFQDEAQSAKPASKVEVDEIVLEGEWDTEPSSPRPVVSRPAEASSVGEETERTMRSELDRTVVRPIQRRAESAAAEKVAAPSRSGPESSAPAARSGAAPPVVRGVQMRAPERGQGGAAATRAVLQFNKVEARGGFSQSDLAQQPTWMKLAIGFGALAIFAGLAWAAFQAVSVFKQSTEGAPIEVEETPDEGER